MQHLWTEGRYLSAYEPHISIGDTCQLLSDIFQLTGGTYKLTGDCVKNSRCLPLMSLTLLVCQCGRHYGGMAGRGAMVPMPALLGMPLGMGIHRLRDISPVSMTGFDLDRITSESESGLHAGVSMTDSRFNPDSMRRFESDQGV